MTDPRVSELQRLLPQCLLPDWVRLGARAVRLFRDQHHPDAHESILQRLLAAARQTRSEHTWPLHLAATPAGVAKWQTRQP